MGNTEGGRLNGIVNKQVYFNGGPPLLKVCCPPRTTLSTETTPSESSKYTANPYKEEVEGQTVCRTTYQGGVSQEQIQSLVTLLTAKNYRTETLRIAAEACPPYVPPFSAIIPPLLVCPPLSPPPLPPLVPGSDPRKCINIR
jgi:hypothetical protein